MTGGRLALCETPEHGNARTMAGPAHEVIADQCLSILSRRQTPRRSVTRDELPASILDGFFKLGSGSMEEIATA